MQHTYRRELSLVEQAIIGPDQWRKWRSSVDLIVDKESGTTSEEARHWSNCQQWFVLLINPALHKLTRGRGRQWLSVKLKLNTHHMYIIHTFKSGQKGIFTVIYRNCRGVKMFTFLMSNTIHMVALLFRSYCLNVSVWSFRLFMSYLNMLTI